ncbi:MAG TPA: class I SAM-dependent methyltransferase [Cellulomonas sp.]
MPTPAVREAYGRRLAEYVDRFGSIDATAAPDRALVGAWARDRGGPVLDVGCGPGQWTAWLHAAGVDVEGVDPVEDFVAGAGLRHPGVRFRVGRAAGCCSGSSRGSRSSRSSTP